MLDGRIGGQDKTAVVRTFLFHLIVTFTILSMAWGLKEVTGVPVVVFITHNVNRVRANKLEQSSRSRHNTLLVANRSRPAAIATTSRGASLGIEWAAVTRGRAHGAWRASYMLRGILPTEAIKLSDPSHKK